MIKEFEKYHGIAFARLIHKYGAMKISANINQDNSSYLINDEFGFYIKFSTKRLTPWQFTFTEQHHQCIEELSESTRAGYVAFVCNFDGICCIKFDDYFKLIKDISEGQAKSISISRSKNEQYYASGTDGELNFKISDSNINLNS